MRVASERSPIAASAKDFFAAWKLEDSFLDGIFRDEAMDKYRFCLTNSMSSVSCLGFGGWVPPGVEEVNMVGSSQVESSTAGLKAE